MARLLVATDLTSLGQRALADRLAARARADGHEATVVTDAPLAACKDADAAICLIDGGSPGAMPIAVAASAHALGLPTLALHTHALADSLASLFSMAQAVTREDDLVTALIPFYAEVRPFAGKLVRDQVPRLVREAGHQVQFREAAPDERVRYLKRKVADEANELMEADPGQEREEVADLLEALETLLRVRGYDREDLRLVKEAKRKRRGGFERFLIVESATTVSSTPPVEAPSAWPPEEPRARPRAVPVPTHAPTPPMPVAVAESEPEPELPPFPEPEEAVDLPGFPEPDRLVPAPTAATPDAGFQMPPAFLDPEPAPAVPTPAPEVPLPSWLTTPPTPAAPASIPVPTPAPQAYAYEERPRAGPTRSYEAPAPLFTPPAIPSFRVQRPVAAPNNSSRLWNLGTKGEKVDIPEAEDDPDRIEPRLRDI